MADVVAVKAAQAALRVAMARLTVELHTAQGKAQPPENLERKPEPCIVRAAVAADKRAVQVAKVVAATVRMAVQPVTALKTRALVAADRDRELSVLAALASQSSAIQGGLHNGKEYGTH